MRAEGLRGASRRKWTRTTIPDESQSPAPDLVDRRCLHNRVEARQAIFTFLESWHNRRHRHESLGYLSPVQFEALNNPNGTHDAARDKRSSGALAVALRLKKKEEEIHESE